LTLKLFPSLLQRKRRRRCWGEEIRR